MTYLTTETQSVPGQISKFAANHPDSVALEYDNQKLNYGELHRRATQFAGYLAKCGTVSGDKIAVCLERSFDWIVAVLAIMKLGAAYVPLDNAWPDERLSYAVSDSGAIIFVARTPLLERLNVKALGVDPGRDREAIAGSSFAICPPVDPEMLAYVIYTSGSTGVPKGVEITHANLAHLVRWHISEFKVTPQDRVSHLLGLGFDAAVLEIWPHLCAGATLCLATDEVRSSPELLHSWIARERISICIVPAVLGARLMAMNWHEKIDLRLMFVGGDALRSGPAVGLPFQVVNNYGPTECTVVSTWALLKAEAEGLPPIGQPVEGARIYLLNEQGEEIQDGDVGEIYISGDGVGRGYRNLPDATKQSFLPDPFLAGRNGRMYRTGDLATRRPDGSLEFRGRLDRQVKIRGYRVELDEIDRVLNRLPEIDFCATVARSSEQGETQLVAYVLCKDGVPMPAARDLQIHLHQSLPDYMVPSSFMPLNSIPLSSNGKIDLTLLREPLNPLQIEEDHFREPASKTENELLSLMRAILVNDRIGVGSNFFLEGGHSLLGMQLIMRLREAFGVEITLKELFAAPTVERLSCLVETKFVERDLASIWSDLVEQEHIPFNSSFFDLGGNEALVSTLQSKIAAKFGECTTVTELQQAATLQQQAELLRRRHRVNDSPLPPGVLGVHTNGIRNNIFWVHILGLDLAREFGEDQPFFFVTLTDSDLEILGKAPTLQSIAACLGAKIQAIQPEGPYTVGGECLGGLLAYEIASQLRADRYEVSLVVLLDSPSPPYMRSTNSLTVRLRNAAYFLLKRSVHVGLKSVLRGIWRRQIQRLSRTLKVTFPSANFNAAHERIEVASLTYRPKLYEGNVLLLIASDRAPHWNFLAGWQACISGNLKTRHLDGHHGALLQPPYLGHIADAITSELEAAVAEKA